MGRVGVEPSPRCLTPIRKQFRNVRHLGLLHWISPSDAIVVTHDVAIEPTEAGSSVFAGPPITWRTPAALGSNGHTSHSLSTIVPRNGAETLNVTKARDGVKPGILRWRASRAARAGRGRVGRGHTDPLWTPWEAIRVPPRPNSGPILASAPGGPVARRR